MRDLLKKGDGFIFVLAVIGCVVFLILYPRLFPEAGIRMDMDKEEIVAKGISFVEGLGYDLTGYHITSRLQYDSDQLRYLNRAFGPSRTNALSDSIPVYHWTIRWTSEDTRSIQLGSGSDEEARQRVEQLRDGNTLLVDLQGRPIGFSFRIPRSDSLRASSFAEVDTRKVADSLAAKLCGMYGGDWTFEENREQSRQFRPFRQYRWNKLGDVAGEKIYLEIGVFLNGRIQNFRQVFQIPKRFGQAKERDDFEGGAKAVLFLVFFILTVIYFIQRLRSDLIDLKSGMLVGIIVTLSCLVVSWIQTPDESFIVVMIVFVIRALLLGGSIWILFSVGESFTREVWADKLFTMDILRRKILFPELGLSLFRGIALMFIGLGVTGLLDYAGIHWFRGYFSLNNDSFYFWTSKWPGLYAIGRSLLSSLYIVVPFYLFLLPLLLRRSTKKIFVLPIVVVLLSTLGFPIPNLQPFFVRMGVNGLVGLLFIFFYLRYDFITVAMGAVGIPLFYYGTSALVAGNGLQTVHGFILMGLFGAVLLLAFFACRGETPSGGVVHYVPDYLRRISEKERIRRELEIARNVQITFLPRMNPEIEGIEIASLCLPAKEVGGDYYDFIEITPKKLGVVIGDVSGKGISAAFYMTLTKGFLKSQARSVFSPKEVLINMNELFYENANRGMFVSMIYGIFDLEHRTLTYARAGHNPMIYRQSKGGLIEEFNSPGIALGLERGDLFAKTIVEKSVPVEKGDVFLMYTDGLNEAQNLFHEEFGEKRLMDVVAEHNAFSATDLLDQIKLEIQRFIDYAPQHDDMTAVIVKIR